jgi:2-oxoglutarate dehydrogenase E2 component (dihydrolipoamide succinyltransferase)
MALIDVVMPKLGESIMEATILRWHKKPGDYVRQDETLMDIATDKVDSEVPSTTEGVLEEALYNENDVVAIGTVIARIRSAVEVQVQTPGPTAVEYKMPTAAPMQEASRQIVAAVPEEIPYQPSMAHLTAPGGIRFYSPLVLNIAASEGIPMSELESIPGTGAEGRVTKKDIMEYLASGRRPSSSRQVQNPEPLHSQPPTVPFVVPVTKTEPTVNERATTPVTSYAGNVEVVEMDRMRKYIAEHMVKSKATSAHVTSFAEADVTHIVQWRERIKKDFEKREGEKITFTPLFIEAIVRSLKKFPLLNSSVDGDRILIKKDINIGMATALTNGNLIVPVIKGADQLNLVGLTRQVNLLANNARNNRLKPDDTQGGTFTFTNVGTFGSLMGTPIISQPQVAILATGAIKKKPVVLETPEGDSIAIRHMMFISMSYDHRIIDGSLGATFVTAVVKELEAFDVNRNI